MMYGKDKAMAKGGMVKKAKPAAKAKKGMAMGGTVAPNQQEMSAMAAKMAAMPGPTAQQLAAAPKATQGKAPSGGMKMAKSAKAVMGQFKDQGGKKNKASVTGKPMLQTAKPIGMAKGGIVKKGKC